MNKLTIKIKDEMIMKCFRFLSENLNEDYKVVNIGDVKFIFNKRIDKDFKIFDNIKQRINIDINQELDKLLGEDSAKITIDNKVKNIKNVFDEELKNIFNECIKIFEDEGYENCIEVIKNLIENLEEKQKNN